jgi:GH25 family lysozyme M1 (1,4-beta-N-acetylmuramidase)
MILPLRSVALNAPTQIKDVRMQQGALAMVNLRVVDIYHGDRVSSFKKAADFGIWGIIHKATTGATGKDAKYPSRRKPAGNAGLLWGAYHWGTKADVAAQVRNFLDYAEPDQSTLVALDFERTGGNTMSLDQAREFLTRIEEELRRKAVIYSGESRVDWRRNRIPSSARIVCG